jgi:hypothetical protein
MTLPRILIITPFRNEEHSVRHYLLALHDLDYPPELIDLYWLENDSTDKTLEILEAAKPKMPFNSTTLETINIIGPQKKRFPIEYFKDAGHGGSRRITWTIIWNDYFLPLIRESDADYVMPWYADGIAPPNVIREYLSVFIVKPDAGWVGGSMHRRKGWPPIRGIGGPISCHESPQNLTFPIPLELAGSKEVVQVDYVGHCWMCPKTPLAKTEFYDHRLRDQHISLIKALGKQGLKVYYQPSVYIKHISTDGVIYNHSLEGETC